MGHLGSFPHRFPLPFYAALRVRAVVNLRCPACRATVAVEEADTKMLRQHSEEAMAEVMAATRRAIPGIKGGGYPPGAYGTAGEGE